MLCTCGNIFCEDCQSYQENFRCPICGMWTLVGGCKNPDKCMSEFVAKSKDLDKLYLEEEKWALKLENWRFQEKVKKILEDGWNE